MKTKISLSVALLAIILFFSNYMYGQSAIEIDN